MKHTLRTIIWVIAVTLGVCASAQTDTKRAFRMYMHDGSVQFFFYSDIQSMTVGYEDGDMERPMQIINTPDSVYTFAMADIDSVSFARPVTEYKSNVVRLEDGLLSYLTASDSLKLTFRSDVPRNLFPTVGGYLVTLECDELLPGGFIGKLASVREEGEGVVALCEMAAVTEVFEKLFISTGDNVDSAKNASQHSKKKANYYNGDIEISPIQNEKVLNDYDYEKGNFQGNYNCKVGYEVSTQKFHVNAFLLIENGYVTYSITTNGEHNLNLNGSLAFSYDYKRRFPIICKSIPIPGFPFFSVKPEFGLYVESNGEIAFEHNSDFPFKTVIHNEFNSRLLSVLENRIPNGAKIVWGEPKHSNSVEGNATVGFGVYGALNLVAVVEEIANVKAGIETGLSFSGKAYKEIGGNSIETPDTKMYDNNNDDEALKCDFAFNGFVEFSSKLFDCLNRKYNYDIAGYVINNPIWKRGVVPEFFDVSLSKSDVAGSLTATAALRRKLAFNANVGLGLYDSSDKLVDSWWCDVKYKDQENTQITHDFSNLKIGEKYTLHPLVHALNDNMVANPSSSNQIEPSIYTQVAKNITHSSATLTALITKMPEDRNFKAGFVYYDTPDNKKTVMVDNNTANVIAEISGLKANTDYSFYAFMQIGDYIETGETKVFKTKMGRLFKLVQTDSESSSNTITGYFKCVPQEADSNKQFVVLPVEISIDGYCSKTYNSLDELYIECNEYNTDIENFTATAGGILKLKYTLYDETKKISEIDDWEYTELEFIVVYNKRPYYEWISHEIMLATGMRMLCVPALHVEGAVWFSSLSAHYGLYSNKRTYDDTGNETIISSLLDQKSCTKDTIRDSPNDERWWFLDYEDNGWDITDLNNNSDGYTTYDIKFINTNATLINGKTF